MATKTTATILQANTSFVATVDGEPVSVREGDTISADHPLARQFPDHFRALVVTHPNPEPRVEQATAAPGEKRGG